MSPYDTLNLQPARTYFLRDAAYLRSFNAERVRLSN